MLGSPPTSSKPIEPFDRFVLEGLREIERASFENDTSEIADGYTLSNFIETRTLDVSTATLTDVKNVLATLLFDMQNRGVKKG